MIMHNANYGRIKKGQMKIQQMAFMLMAVTLFFTLVGLLILVFAGSGLKESATQLEEENAMLLVSKLANSPEFSCGESFGTSKINCVDADKLIALIENSEDYENFWGVSNIEVREIYPSDEDVLCSIQNYPNCNIIRIYDKDIQGYDTSNFVSLCRKNSYGEGNYNKCVLAKMSVSYEEK